MKIFCTASSDAYITDKIVNQEIRVDDANTGRAGTLDLFKLYDETLLNGTGSQNEVSRLLLKFDLSNARSLLNSKLDVRSENFKAVLKLFDIQSGHSSPSNFSVIAHPLSKSFDEGIGRDISEFADLGVVNFLTASIVNGAANVWHISGANSVGALNSELIDIISHGTVGEEDFTYFGTQKFFEGNEDLAIDVTKAISGTLTNNIPDLGFRIAFSGSDETDKKTRFVKRFATRHSANPHIRPRIEISFDDSQRDDRNNFYFDTTGSLFLRNFKKSRPSNLIAGGAQVQGSDTLTVKLVKGSFEKTFTGMQLTEGSNDAGMVGVYTASFAISSEEAGEYAPGRKLSSLIASDKEVTFDEYWSYGTKGFYTGSLTIKSDDTSVSFVDDDVEVFATNIKTKYSRENEERITLFAVDHSKRYEKPKKKSIKKKSEIFDEVYYRVLDADSLQPIIEFGEDDNSTRVSTDNEGMFFSFHFSILPPGRSYVFEFLVKNSGMRKVIRDQRSRFTVK